MVNLYLSFRAQRGNEMVRSTDIPVDSSDCCPLQLTKNRYEWVVGSRKNTGPCQTTPGMTALNPVATEGNEVAGTTV